MRVLLVEDDPNATKAVSLMLRSVGAVVDQADTGEEAVELTSRYDYDVVFLDLMLPDVDGYNVVRRIRAAGIGTPVVILSGLSRPEAKVRGFAVGADDFVTKPFDRAELLARMQAVVRRSRGLSKSMLRLGDLEINLDSKEVTVSEKPVHLTAKEYSILELLALRRGTVLTKEAFLNHLYGGMDEPEIKIVDVFICKLRKKLARAGLTGLIGTSWGHGYMVHDVAPSRARAPEPTIPAPTTI